MNSGTRADRSPQQCRERQRGFTLIELLLVVAIIGIITAIAIPMYSSLDRRARVSKAQADLHSVATAVVLYGTHMGDYPTSLSDLTVATANTQGQIAGPFLNGIPVKPGPSWTDYPAGYTVDSASGTFAISAAGDGATIEVP